MAQRTVVILVDDITGVEIDEGNGESVSFGLDGHQYSIDLTAENASNLRSVLQKYVDAAKPLGRGPRPRAATSKTTIGPSPVALRAWGRSNGFQVPDRGRVPYAVREAYAAAH